MAIVAAASSSLTGFVCGGCTTGISVEGGGGGTQAPSCVGRTGKAGADVGAVDVDEEGGSCGGGKDGGGGGVGSCCWIGRKGMDGACGCSIVEGSKGACCGRT